ncbi:hypothetical protein [Chroococcidiopsis sp.]|uniref:hypothetical protein n=1 Tax=Chroococcidiopsis sp. TaxID=3088168 RepID=UPI003F382F60
MTFKCLDADWQEYELLQGKSTIFIHHLLPIWQLVSTKKKQWITFKVSELEMQALEAYCQQTQRTKTDVLRDLIRGLPTYTNSRSATRGFNLNQPPHPEEDPNF